MSLTADQKNKPVRPRSSFGPNGTQLSPISNARRLTPRKNTKDNQSYVEDIASATNPKDTVVAGAAGDLQNVDQMNQAKKDAAAAGLDVLTNLGGQLNGIYDNAKVAPSTDIFQQLLDKLGNIESTLQVNPYTDAERQKVLGQKKDELSNQNRLDQQTLRQNAASRGLAGSPILDAETNLKSNLNRQLLDADLQTQQQQREINTAANLARAGFLGDVYGNAFTGQAQNALGTGGVNAGLATSNANSALGVAGAKIPLLQQQYIPDQFDYGAFTNSMLDVGISEDTKALINRMIEEGRIDELKGILPNLFGGIASTMPGAEGLQLISAALNAARPLF